MAAVKGHLAIVQELLVHGADVDAADKEGGTALYAASCTGHTGVVQALLDKGAKIDVKVNVTVSGTNKVWTAVDAAAANGHFDVLGLLAKADRGVSVNSVERLPGSRSRLKPPAQPPAAVLRVSVRSITKSVSKVGGRYRFRIRVEGDNESNVSLGWSGVTINVPTLDSRESYIATEIQMSSLGCSAPFHRGSDDVIFGFRNDGSFGELGATCLFMESVCEQWPPHERIALEAVLFTPASQLDFQVRVWSNRPSDGGAFGDPDWKTTEHKKDQQGIPAYSISLSVGALAELKSFFLRLVGAKCGACGKRTLGRVPAPAGTGVGPQTMVCKACSARLKAEADARAEAKRLKAEADARAEAERLKAEADARADAERLKAEADARAEAERLKAEADATSVVGMTFAHVPAGQFTMGSPEDERGASCAYSSEHGRYLPTEIQHSVRISRAFLMGACTVTRGQFSVFVDATGYVTDAERTGFAYVSNRMGKVEGVSWRNPSLEQGDDHPVVCVSWNDALSFCGWLNDKEGKRYRLPTEAEWEYAARAGTTTPFHFGPVIANDRANFNGDFDASLPWNRPAQDVASARLGPRRKNTTAVGTFAANPWGLYDMHGNVWEWCSDWEAKYLSEPMVDPIGPQTGSSRIKRGGSWNSYGHSCRAAYRLSGSPDKGDNDTGFRVVCEI